MLCSRTGLPVFHKFTSQRNKCHTHPAFLSPHWSTLTTKSCYGQLVCMYQITNADTWSSARLSARNLLFSFSVRSITCSSQDASSWLWCHVSPALEPPISGGGPADLWSLLKLAEEARRNESSSFCMWFTCGMVHCHVTILMRPATLVWHDRLSQLNHTSHKLLLPNEYASMNFCTSLSALVIALLFGYHGSPKLWSRYHITDIIFSKFIYALLLHACWKTSMRETFGATASCNAMAKDPSAMVPWAMLHEVWSTWLVMLCLCTSLST